ncbi:MAG: type IV secretion system protein [Phenylobacterium sp.]|uniref:type IV secretion system protein n=1 Tax=Phenylobacterium sp. TaxID=1871053 RepID=UPI0025CC68BD|nr:type IV secretion system protein [Phenylobacterium sp.]MBI1198936.1 type IV secretion system protein [Phenylobacterium sp.]
MKKMLVAASAALVLSLGTSSAQAQMIVHDPTSYAKLIAQAQTALDQLNELKARVQQGRELFTSLNEASIVSTIAGQLGVPELREFLPQIDALAAAAKGDLASLGKIGQRADEIRAGLRLYTPADGDQIGAEIEAAGDRAARDLALGEAVATAGAERLEGLKALQAAIDSAPSARAVLDLQARAATEQAMVANDQMRLQGLAMAQAAEDRLQAQRERERMMAEREARMAAYKRGFS